MVDSPLGLTVAFNGCIYNYKDLRAELEGHGHRFFSTSDTEVIGKAYAQWGTSCVDHFLGMFAFAVVEHATGRLVLARDRLGIKPLYLDQTPARLRFASSLPALLAGRRHGHLARPGRAGLLHDVPQHRAAAAHDPQRGQEAAARRPSGSSSPTGRGPSTRTGPRPSPATPSRPAGASATGRRRCSSPCASPSTAGWSPTCRSGCCSPAASTPRSSSRCWPRPGSTTSRRSASASRPAAGSAGDEFEYSSLVAQRFGTDHHRIMIDDSRLLPGVDATIAAMSEPMVSHDCVAFYLLSEDVAQERQGRAVRAGRRRGARRLRLVPAAGRRRPRGRRRGVRGRVLRPALVGHARPRVAGAG